jgi:hypothetical protein
MGLSGSCRRSAQPASHPARCGAPLQAPVKTARRRGRGRVGDKVAPGRRHPLIPFFERRKETNRGRFSGLRTQDSALERTQ